ncbi:MAG: hypothetical protein ACFFB0_22000 [Promethearchaeota archaeon]
MKYYKKNMEGIKLTAENYVDKRKRFYESLNNNNKFKEKFKDEKFKILLNPKDGKYAALIIVEKGTVSVEKLPNYPISNFDENILGWDAMMQTTLEIFDEIGQGKLSTSAIMKKVLMRKIKMKNPILLLKLNENDELLKEEGKNSLLL